MKRLLEFADSYNSYWFADVLVFWFAAREEVIVGVEVDTPQIKNVEAFGGLGKLRGHLRLQYRCGCHSAVPRCHQSLLKQ